MLRRHAFPVLLALLLGVLAAPSGAAARTIPVNSGRDVLADDGTCTLREAVIAANEDAPSGATPGECPAGQGPDEIDVAVPLVTLTIPGRDEVASRTGDLDVLGDLIIAGAGPDDTTIDAGGIDRALRGRPGSRVTLRDLTITGGLTGSGTSAPPDTDGGQGQRGGDGGLGGGIFAEGDLALRDVVVTGNRTGDGGAGQDVSSPSEAVAGAEPATGGAGGAGGGGGGVFSLGSLIVANSAIIDNVSGNGGRGGNATAGSGGTAPDSGLGAQGGEATSGAGGFGGPGGGLVLTGTATITHSSFSGNTTGDGGGGGRAEGGTGGAGDGAKAGPGGQASSQVGGAGGAGGGVYVAGPTTMTDVSVTADNTGRGGPGDTALGGTGGPADDGTGGSGGPANAGPGGAGGDGGGIRVVIGGSLTIIGSLIAVNTTGPGTQGGTAFGGVGANGDAGFGGRGGAGIGGSGGRGGLGGGIAAVQDLDADADSVSQNGTGAGGDGGSGFGLPGGKGLGGFAGGDGGNGRAGDGGPAGSGAGAMAGGRLTQVTVAGNTASASGGAPGDAAGGSGGAGSPGTLPGDPGTTTPGTTGAAGTPGGVGAGPAQTAPDLRNSIISANLPAACGRISDLGGNIAFPDASCPGALLADPLLSTLAGHGGATPTFALQPGSPAIDSVPAAGAGCDAADQRGVDRPQGPACDAGAYEVAPPGARTDPATVATQSVRLRGTVDPNAQDTQARFEFGRTTAYGSRTAPQDVGDGTPGVSVTALLTGLPASTTFHYRVIASNGDGSSAGADRTFRTPSVAISGPGGGSTPPGGGATRPKLTHLRLKPARFRPATKRHHLHRGTTIAYRDTQAARTGFAVAQRRAGVRRGGHCIKPPRGRRVAPAKRCRRFVRLKGSFHHADRVGADHLHWSGRLRGRALAPGAYRLLARPAHGARVARRFRIRG